MTMITATKQTAYAWMHQICLHCTFFLGQKRNYYWDLCFIIIAKKFILFFSQVA